MIFASSLASASGIDAAGGVPEAAQERHALGVVPHGRGHYSSRLGDAVHLLHRGRRVAHEVHDELGQDHVKAVGVERKLFGRRLAHGGPGDAGPARLHERRGRVDGGDAIVSDDSSQCTRDRARATADVERALPGRHARDFEQPARELVGVAADVALVCVDAGPERPDAARLSHAPTLRGYGCPTLPPVLWHIELSHYNEKVRWALDYKGVAHVRKAPVPGLHGAVAMWITRGAQRRLP